MYERHPSAELNALFRHRPYQGAEPEQARYVFVGLDANYDSNIEQGPNFTSILDYHSDGVAFWRRHGVHHPFLLPNYKGAGRRYHLNFARIGFTAKDADLVSFIELLHVPTVGRSKLVPGDLDRMHLARIAALVISPEPRYIFVSDGVVRLMRSTDLFPWLALPKRSRNVLSILYDHGKSRIYKHLHFSNYGKFQEQLTLEAKAIAQLCGRDG
jgi:hypothetical protein